MKEGWVRELDEVMDEIGFEGFEEVRKEVVDRVFGMPKIEREEKTKKHGLYFLYDKSKKLIYVGKSVNIYNRVFQSIQDKKKEVRYFRFMQTEMSYADCCVYEIYLINKHKPKLNKESNTGDELNILLPEIKLSKYYNILCITERKKPKFYSDFDIENKFNKSGFTLIYNDFKKPIKIIGN